MAVEEAVRLDDRNRRQRTILNIAVQIGDILEIGAQTGIGHNLRRIEEGVADIAVAAVAVELLTALRAVRPALAVVSPRYIVLAQHQSQVVFLAGWNGEVVGTALICYLARTVVSGIVIVDEVVR